MKIGIFGGCFDPVHYGHLAMAEAAMKAGKLNKIIFVPNGNPPHKNGVCASGVQRYEMLRLALYGEKRFQVSDYEVNQNKPCYTVETMRHFRARYPGCRLYFIMGADSLDYVDKWYEAEKLREENEFIVINRNFKKDYDFEESIRKCTEKGYSIIKADMPCIDISSTMIRERIKNGESIKDLTFFKVCKFIEDSKLYCKEPY